MIKQYSLTIKTKGRGLVDLTHDVAGFIAQSTITIGICHLFLHHTSASLTLCENADPLVHSDLEEFMQRLVPDGDRYFQHVAEGPDDMSAHVRTVLTQTFLSLPITGKKLNLGTWQGIYLWEHRFKGHERRLTVTLMGE